MDLFNLLQQAVAVARALDSALLLMASVAVLAISVVVITVLRRMVSYYF